MSMYEGIFQVREVLIDDKKGMDEMLAKGWKPLNIVRTFKRRLWWKKTTYSILFGQMGVSRLP